MAPLVPYEIIGTEWNYIIAFVIGISFGFILESAGFSSSRVLAGVFYGYDFTVLRVFFTAGVTAMIGILILNQFGVMDLNLLYINPTFLWSAVIGGVIMGAGFIIGGFCPGTSVCALAIGKIDAMVFFAGIFIGIFLFAELYPMFENLYLGKEAFADFATGQNRAIKINETFGISKALFALIMLLVAVGAFIFTARIQKRTRKVEY